MINIQPVLQNDRLLKIFTGLHRQAFAELCESFGFVYERTQSPTSKPRQRVKGGGRKARLRRNEDKLLFILFYVKHHPTFEVLSTLFGLDRGRAHRWVHRLQTSLEIASGHPIVLPERKLTSVEQFLKAFPEVKVLMMDGTDRTIQYQQEPQQPEQSWGGKQRLDRKHTTGAERKKSILTLKAARTDEVHCTVSILRNRFEQIGGIVYSKGISILCSDRGRGDASGWGNVDVEAA
jgi:Helix-turn-helix of DDE superfamily endonuclease